MSKSLDKLKFSFRRKILNLFKNMIERILSYSSFSGISCTKCKLQLQILLLNTNTSEKRDRRKKDRPTAGDIEREPVDPVGDGVGLIP